MSINVEDLATRKQAATSANADSSHSSGPLHETARDQEGLQLFQRALTLGDDDAWCQLIERYQGLVLAWVRNHSRHDLAYRYHNSDYYVALAFERFWQATARNRSLTFTSLESALSYLKASLNGAILDTLRTYTRPEMPLPEPGSLYTIELSCEDSPCEQELWDVIQNLLPTARERRVAYLLFYCGLKPREIVKFCQDEFPEVREVHRLRRNIVERLLRQADTIRWRLGDDD